MIATSLASRLGVRVPIIQALGQLEREAIEAINAIAKLCKA